MLINVCNQVLCVIPYTLLSVKLCYLQVFVLTASFMLCFLTIHGAVQNQARPLDVCLQAWDNILLTVWSHAPDIIFIKFVPFH